MVSTTRNKIFQFVAFLLPALVFYALFFLIPLAQGVWYSFTDWNGIVPEIPLMMDKTEFEGKVLSKLKDKADKLLISRYYRLVPGDDVYNLTHWVEEKGHKPRELSKGERRRIKAVLRSVGISNIHLIGLANFKEMFKDDTRFMPRFERRYLFNEFDDLPGKIPERLFTHKLVAHLKNPEDKVFVLRMYTLRKGFYELKPKLGEDEEERLRVTLANHLYENAFIPNVLGFTVFFTFFNVLLANLLALLLALILDGKLRTRVMLRSIFFMPNVLSLVIVAFIWHFIFMLILPRITGISIWLGSMTLAPWAIIMVSVWQSCGWLMVIYLAGLQTIPTEFQEAAEVDGASWMQRLRFIKMPLLLPALTICLFYSLSNSLKSFDIIFALTQGNPAYSTVPVVLDIYYNAFNLNRFGYATAKAVFLCAVIMIVTGIQLTMMKRREVQL
ncbi:MAG TPA: sugar ABC transporter permease [Bacillota bacterium]|nr:sugar ABC transporter permease [Bacillota bacterium]